MAEATAEFSQPKPSIRQELQPPEKQHRGPDSLGELAKRAEEIKAEEPNVIMSALPLAVATSAKEAQAITVAPSSETLLPKRAWWKNVLSKPIPLPRRMVDGMITDYHKAFPEVFGDNPVRPNITYEHSLYFPPFNVIDVKAPKNSFSKKYPLFNEFITQSVSEEAARKRKLLGPLFGLAARFVGATSYKLIYLGHYRRWRAVEGTLDQKFGKAERRRLVARAYFLEGEHLTRLEEKTKEAGRSIEEAYAPVRRQTRSFVDDSFWERLPGKWKDVVVRLAAGAVAHAGKITDVALLTLITIFDANAVFLGATILASKLPLLSTVAATSFPLYTGINLALMGALGVGFAYHEMGHQMTKTLLDLNARAQSTS